MTHAVVKLAVDLGLKVTAEGIETEEQKRFLADRLHRRPGLSLRGPCAASGYASISKPHAASRRTGCRLRACAWAPPDAGA
ncbi:MAG: hypothetical protein HPM95_01390 [Alphaproteobacteria bacterium]|nr:hypothetical protein [Alphaproteobacteria bacterium]